MDLNRLEYNLKQRLQYAYNWGCKQNNEMDNLTKFIYNSYGLKKVFRILDEIKANQSLKDYTLNRWYNYHSAQGIEYIFQQYKNVKKMNNIYHKTIDFFVDGIPFDHKTTVLPKHYKNDVKKAMNNKKELIEWLYKNQSKEKREHYKNRLFIVVFDNSEEKAHWKIKSEISFIKDQIDEYMINFNKSNLIEVNINNSLVYSDVLFILRN